MNTTQDGDLAMLVGADRDRNQHFLHLTHGDDLQMHRGVLHHDDLIGIPWGAVVRSHLGHRFYLLKPTMRDLLLHTKRRSQIIFPKDIGYILLRLSIGPGKEVIEAGTGSGALTTAFAWSVGQAGRVYTYDRRQDMQALARRNLERLGLADRVTWHRSDIEAGFQERGIEALFMDLPTPHLHLRQVWEALSPGGALGAIVPTTNQVSDLLKGLNGLPFTSIEVCEIALRFYKAVPERLRPVDRMVAHTGYLVFARSILPEARAGYGIDTAGNVSYRSEAPSAGDKSSADADLPGVLPPPGESRLVWHRRQWLSLVVERCHMKRDAPLSESVRHAGGS